MFGFLYDGFMDILTWIFTIFPDDPISDFLYERLADPQVINVIGHINYFVPIGTIATITNIWFNAMVSLFVAIKIKNSVGR